MLIYIIILWSFLHLLSYRYSDSPHFVMIGVPTRFNILYENVYSLNNEIFFPNKYLVFLGVMVIYVLCRLHNYISIYCFEIVHNLRIHCPKYSHSIINPNCWNLKIPLQLICSEYRYGQNQTGLKLVSQHKVDVIAVVYLYIFHGFSTVIFTQKSSLSYY